MRRPQAVKKRARRSKPRSRPAGRVRRFLRAFIVSGLAAFSAGSYLLHPELRESISLEPMLARVGSSGPGAPPPAVVAEGPQARTRFGECPQFFPSGRPPVVPAGGALRELCFSSFAILHDGRTKTPVFVAQRLNRRMLAQAKNIQRTDRFYPEARLPSAERAELDDYRNSGYSRGHMAPAGDMHTGEAMAQSFSLANMAPQDQQHNAGAWARIESDTRKYVMRARGDVYVFTGPVHAASSRVIGAGRVAVPDYFYKLVFDAETGRSWVHWQANSRHAAAGPPISYQEFARRTGLDLLPPAPRSR